MSSPTHPPGADVTLSTPADAAAGHTAGHRSTPGDGTGPSAVDRQHLATLMAGEQADFIHRNPTSLALSQRAAAHLLFGVPLHWMNDWPTPCALHVASASGAELVDADGHVLVDFCLGDSGAMFGHSPPAVQRALIEQASRGYTTMLPGDAAVWLGEALTARFGLPHWQFALSASDANRFLLRWIRAATGRSRLLVFDGCYHGTVDDVFVDLVDAVPTQRASLLGQVHELTRHTTVIPFNDLAALEAALSADHAEGRIACLLAEPVMTNIGMVLPDLGYWPAAQALLRKHGVLLVLDETHTFSCGPGGWARANGVLPDALVLGKAIAGGLPCATYGMSADLAARAVAAKRSAPAGHSGIGTTLSANRLGLATMRATLAEVATPAAFDHMAAMAERLDAGLRATITRYRLPWCVTHIGARVEFQFCPIAPRSGAEAAAAFDDALEQYLHLALLNRGVLITPFHNMMLLSPVTRADQVERLVDSFDAVLAELA
ncbi:MAG: hypothetical protein RL375_4622 [Pseudomonadota bacterium]